MENIKKRYISRNTYSHSVQDMLGLHIIVPECTGLRILSKASSPELLSFFNFTGFP